MTSAEHGIACLPGANDAHRRRQKPGEGEQEGISSRVKPLPSRKAKRHLIEVMRDLALEDADFAAVVLPLFEEFMTTRGQSELAVCLVAITRMKHAHPQFVPPSVGAARSL